MRKSFAHIKTFVNSFREFFSHKLRIFFTVRAGVGNNNTGETSIASPMPTIFMRIKEIACIPVLFTVRSNPHAPLLLRSRGNRPMTFSDWLSEQQVLGETLPQFAERIGIPYMTLYGIIKNGSEPESRTIRKIAAGLELPIEEVWKALDADTQVIQP
ncbi:MAG: helix-turn-helix transcriptional regulator [bacterium]